MSFNGLKPIDPTVKNVTETSDKKFLDNLFKTNDLSKNYTKEYKEGLKDNTPNTGGSDPFNSVDAEYVGGINVSKNSDLSKAYNHQPFTDKVVRSGTKLWAGIKNGFAQAALNTLDIEQTFNMFAGKEKEFETTFASLNSKELQDNFEKISQENKVYEENPGKVNFLDPGYLLNQISSAGTGIGMATYAGLETVALTAATSEAGGTGGFLNAAKWISKFPQILKYTKNANTLRQGLNALNTVENISQIKNILNTVGAFSMFRRAGESGMEAQTTYHSNYDMLKNEKDDNGQPKFTEEQIKKYSAEGAMQTYKENMLLAGLDYLTMRSMIYNPLSGSSTGIVEKGLEKVASIFGKSKLGKAAGWSLTKSFGLLGEGVEEGYQHIAQKHGEHIARELGGLEKHKSFADITKENVGTDEFWNNFIGGVVGAPVIAGVMKATKYTADKTIDRKNAQIRSTNKENFKNYVSNLTRNTLNLTKEIREKESKGEYKKANELRQTLSSVHALQAIMLDGYNDSTASFDIFTLSKVSL